MSEKCLLVFGGGGQLGQALAESSPPSGWRIVTLLRAAADITQANSINRAITDHDPAVIVNAAAYIAVDKAESDAQAAFRINRDGAGIVARAAATAKRAVIHISTDYVFDGRGGRPWREDDPTVPLGVYGASKLAGELAVRQAGGGHIILRTSWVFGVHGQNFVKTMLRLGAERPELRIVDDQIGRPTYAGDLAKSITAIAARISDQPAVDATGTFHFAGDGAVSWFGFAQAIFAEAHRRGGPNPSLVPIPTSQYPTPAKRPANSELNCDKLQSAYDIHPRSWRAGLGECLDRLLRPVPPS